MGLRSSLDGDVSSSYCRIIRNRINDFVTRFDSQFEVVGAERHTERESQVFFGPVHFSLIGVDWSGPHMPINRIFGEIESELKIKALASVIRG